MKKNEKIIANLKKSVESECRQAFCISGFQFCIRNWNPRAGPIHSRIDFEYRLVGMTERMAECVGFVLGRGSLVYNTD